MLFGSDLGEHDEMLYSCPIKLSACKEQTRIFTGRWGSGKSAHLFLSNKDLSDHLAGIDREKRKLWYIDENSLDVKALLDLRNTCGTTKEFRVQVEHIWKAEIVRAAAMLLGFIAQGQSTTDANHWSFVKAAYKGGSCAEPVWKNIRPLLKLLFNDRSRLNGALELTGRLEDMATAKALTLVQRCLRDIEGKIPPIGIAIDPVDTPKSSLEGTDPSTAQDVIAALINTFLMSFQPDPDNKLKVFLAVPWHRYTIEGIVNPQWRRTYESHLSWDKNELLTFISSRIGSEFKGVGRIFHQSEDVWSKLYTKTFRNNYCKDNIYENTFDYILRHTHHRPRDVQRICRRAVEICSDSLGRSIDDVVAGKGGIKVQGSHIRNAVNEYCNDQMEDFQEEARRRIPRMPEYENAIRGVSVPFTVDELGARASRFGLDINIEDLVLALWETGYVGIEARCKAHCDANEMKSHFPDRTKVVHRTAKGKELIRWYLFSYNWKGNPFDQFSLFESHEGVKLQCVLHPRTFEAFTRKVTQEWPIGI